MPNEFIRRICYAFKTHAILLLVTVKHGSCADWTLKAFLPSVDTTETIRKVQFLIKHFGTFSRCLDWHLFCVATLPKLLSKFRKY
jgi:hypothetical protein